NIFIYLIYKLALYFLSNFRSKPRDQTFLQLLLQVQTTASRSCYLGFSCEDAGV
ncbi:unnamed protein product, partial [Arabidopsis halleri]